MALQDQIRDAIVIGHMMYYCAYFALQVNSMMSTV